jgi:hypothetical protein
MLHVQKGNAAPCPIARLAKRKECLGRGCQWYLPDAQPRHCLIDIFRVGTLELLARTEKLEARQAALMASMEEIKESSRKSLEALETLQAHTLKEIELIQNTGEAEPTSSEVN